MKSFLKILAVIAGIILVFFLVHKKDEWTGFFYSDGDFYNAPLISPDKFEDKEACLSWAKNIKDKRSKLTPSHPEDLYECGLNCKDEGTGRNFICKETVD